MFYLFLSAACVVAVGSGYKVATTMRLRRPVVGSIMLLAGGLILGVVGLWRGNLHFSMRQLALAVAAGVSLYLCTAAFFQVMRYGRLAIQWTVINMAVAVPTLFSITVWGERPTGLIWAGFVAAAAAMVFMGIDKGKTRHRDSSHGGVDPRLGAMARLKWSLLIAVAFLGTGFVQVFHKAMVEDGVSAQFFGYLWVCMMSGGVLGALYLAYRRCRPSAREVGLGLYMAVSMTLAMGALLVALAALPAIVVLPLRSACAIVLTTLLSIVVWGERVQWPGMVGLGLAIVAICCLQAGG